MYIARAREGGAKMLYVYIYVNNNGAVYEQHSHSMRTTVEETEPLIIRRGPSDNDYTLNRSSK